MALLTFQLVAAYLVVAFVLPAPPMQGVRGLALRTLAYGATSVLLLNLGLDTRTAVVVAILAIAHTSLEWAHAAMRETRSAAKRPASLQPMGFVLSHSGHLVLILLAMMWLRPDGRAHLQQLMTTLLQRTDAYVLLCGYLGVVFAGGRFVQTVTESFLAKVDDGVKTLKPGLPEAGKYIGWVERSLVLTFVVGGFADAIGFLLAVKALTRFPEISGDTKGHFAEYFLVGTLTSVGLALVGGVLLKWAIAIL